LKVVPAEEVDEELTELGVVDSKTAAGPAAARMKRDRDSG
jgi:hypothetical protein